MKIFKWVCMAMIAVMLTACGIVETGEVGVRKSIGKVDTQEVQQGFYTAIMSSVDTYTFKETSFELRDLKPRAADNLSLKDLDITVYYQMAPDKIADFASEYSGMSARFAGDHFIRPGLILVRNLASGEVNDQVAKMPSLTLHQNRNTLEEAVKKGLQAQLDLKTPGYFTINRVVVTSIQTDPAIEASIQKSIQAEKDLEIATKQVQVKQQQALANEKLTQSLTPAYLQYEYIKALQACGERGDCTMIVDSGNTPKMVNLGK